MRRTRAPDDVGGRSRERSIIPIDPPGERGIMAVGLWTESHVAFAPMGDTVSDFLICDLDDHIIERLELRALRANTSLEEIVRRILTDAAGTTKAEMSAEVDRAFVTAEPSEVSSVKLLRASQDGGDADA
jgi:plasmid stability protein